MMQFDQIFMKQLSSHHFIFPIIIVIIPFSPYVSFLFLLLWSNATSTMEATIILPENLTFPAIIVFGDSIMDQGTNNYIQTMIKANHPPYGSDFMGGRPTGRFTNARTVADLIANEIGVKELVPPYLDPSLQSKDLLTGVSFASAGTGFDPVTPTLLSVLSPWGQMKLFKEYITKIMNIAGEERAKYIISNGLFLVAAGSDDLVNTYFPMSRFLYDIDTYTNTMVLLASNFVEEIYKLGGRRVAVFSLPPIGCVPAVRTLSGGELRLCAEEYNQAAQVYNKYLFSQLHSLRMSLPHFKVVYIDIYNPILHLIQNPLNYGFEVINKGCCGTGKIEVTFLCNEYSPTCVDHSKYLFWDSFHLTEKGYKILIDRYMQGYVHDFL